MKVLLPAYLILIFLFSLAMIIRSFRFRIRKANEELAMLHSQSRLSGKSKAISDFSRISPIIIHD